MTWQEEWRNYCLGYFPSNTLKHILFDEQPNFGLDFIQKTREDAVREALEKVEVEVRMITPVSKEINYHQSYNEGKIDLSSKVLSIINKHKVQ